MSILVKQIDIKDSAMWDEFVENSYNGTIFSKLKFLQYHPENRFKFTNLAFLENNELVAVISGGIVNSTFKSPVGASYGGFVFKTNEFAHQEELIDAFMAYLDKLGVTQIQITSAPRVYSSEEAETLDFILKYKGFNEMHHLISSIKPLWSINSKLIDSFSSMHKRAIAKSMKQDIQVEINDDYDNFYNMLLENKKKFNVLPTHTLEELKFLKTNFPDNLKLFMAYDKQKEPIAGILIFVCNKSVILAFYIAHYFAKQELRGVNRLFFEVATWGKENKFNYLDFGVSMDTFSINVMEPSRSLIFFKEGTGARGFKRTTWHYEKNTSNRVE